METDDEHFLIQNMKDTFTDYTDKHHNLIANSINYMNEKLHEANEKFDISNYEQYEWLEGNCIMEFSTNNIPKVVAKAHYIGFIENDEWTWSWAEEDINEKCKGSILELKEIGKEYNISFLKNSSFKANENIGWVMSAIFALTFKTDMIYRIHRCNAIEFYALRKMIKL